MCVAGAQPTLAFIRVHLRTLFLCTNEYPAPLAITTSRPAGYHHCNIAPPVPETVLRWPWHPPWHGVNCNPAGHNADGCLPVGLSPDPDRGHASYWPTCPDVPNVLL